MRASDVPEIAQIHVDSWRAAYRGILADDLLEGLRVEERAAVWRHWIEGEDVEVWIAEEAGRIEGFCRLCAARPIDAPPDRFAEVTHLYVRPGRTRSGWGRALLTEAIGFARFASYAGLLLWVLEDNGLARRFYESMGLAPDGGRHDEPDWLGPGVFEVRYAVRFDAPG